MVGRFRHPIAFAASLAAVATLAITAAASPASATNVAPHQYFVGQVYGLITGSSSADITVVCPGPANLMGHPAANQYVEVQQIFPPVSGTAGYTGDDATRIDANLTWGLSNPLSIAIFTQYSVKMQIPTDILVPCSGTGTMSFNPDHDVAGTSSLVSVTFVNIAA